MNKTRIKIVSETVDGVITNKYTCQYLIVSIPLLLWEWWPIHISIEQEATFAYINEAKKFVDQWVATQKDYRKQEQEKVDIVKQKKDSRSITYMYYA